MLRRLAPLLILALLAPALTSRALAQDDAKPRRTRVIAPAPAAVEAPKPAERLALPAIAALPGPTATGSAAQCRTTCAQARYVCTAQNPEGEDCTATWGQCVIGCSGSAYAFSSTAGAPGAAAAFGQGLRGFAQSGQAASPR